MVVEGDYPRHGCRGSARPVKGCGRALAPAGGLMSAAELAAAGPGQRTRRAGSDWVDSFTGRALDLHDLCACAGEKECC